MMQPAAVHPVELLKDRKAFPPPIVVDVRSRADFERDPALIAGAIRRDADAVDAWAQTLEPWRGIVVYCQHGQSLSTGVAAALAGRGPRARCLVGGIDGWRAHDGPTVAYAPPTRWVTRERPKIDRIACPWLIRRFIDPSAEFFYVPTTDVRAFARDNAAEPYDVPDVAYTHIGPECSFDAFVHRHALDHPALADLALIVRGADTGVHDLASQSAGLLATSLGLSQMFRDDLEMLRYGMLVYDALYAWCIAARGETHGWDPDRLRREASAR